MEFKKESMTNSDQNINKILQRKRSLKISRGYMNRNISVIIMSVLLALPVISRGSYKPGQATERAILLSQFISTDIRIDGIAEAVWNNVKPSRIGVSMTGNLSARAAECPTYGNVRSLWDGALLYLLIDVSDNDVTSAGRRATDKDGVEIYLDLWNDKFPKNEEDDGIIRRKWRLCRQA
jgi:hypothetical protein